RCSPFHETATTEIHTLSLHDALPILKAMEWNTDQLRENDPDAWEQVQRYKKTSLDLFYKFSSKNYYLLPEWLDRKKTSDFGDAIDRKSTRLNSSHVKISYAVFCLKKK